MNDLRTAAQQALEALEYNGLLKKRQAITALRAALVQQAEPLNLSDPAVQKRLATQWGYVPAAAQAEPVEPVSNEAMRLAGLALIGLAEHDQHCDVFDLDDQGRHKVCTCGLNDAIAVITQAGKSAPPQQAEPVGQLAELQAMLRAEVDRLIAAGIQPQRQPLTQEESDNIYREFTLYQDRLTPSVLQRIVRAIERAHGIKE